MAYRIEYLTVLIENSIGRQAHWILPYSLQGHIDNPIKSTQSRLIDQLF